MEGVTYLPSEVYAVAFGDHMRRMKEFQAEGKPCYPDLVFPKYKDGTIGFRWVLKVPTPGSWVVFNFTTGGLPKVEHPSKERAQAEASRLGAENPDQWFVVMQVQRVSRTHTPPKPKPEVQVIDNEPNGTTG